MKKNHKSIFLFANSRTSHKFHFFVDFSTLCQGKIVPEQNNVTTEEGKKLDIFGIKPSQAREGKIIIF